jgi:hypothetical protein
MRGDDRPAVEVAWFCPLCDDDYESLGVADPQLKTAPPAAIG